MLTVTGVAVTLGLSLYLTQVNVVGIERNCAQECVAE